MQRHSWLSKNMKEIRNISQMNNETNHGLRAKTIRLNKPYDDRKYKLTTISDMYDPQMCHLKNLNGGRLSTFGNERKHSSQMELTNEMLATWTPYDKTNIAPKFFGKNNHE